MIYHYTTLETLLHLLTPNDSLEIIDTCSPIKINIIFHATGIQFLNDTKENQLLPSVFRELKIPTEALYTLDSVNGLPYALSFSMDNDNLTMWRNYANDGHGVALGFDEEVIKDHLDDLYINYIGKCEYTSVPELKKEIENHDLYKEHLHNPSNLNSLLALYYHSLKYKHKAFADEKEYRIAFCRHTDEEFRTTIDGIATYQNLAIPFEALRTIVVGPCMDFEKTKFSISRMMQRYLYGLTEHWELIITSMYKSDAPYIS